MRRRVEPLTAAAGDPPAELLVFDPDDWPAPPLDGRVDHLPDRQLAWQRQAQRVAWVDARDDWMREHQVRWLPGDPAAWRWVRLGEAPGVRADRLAHARQVWRDLGPDGPFDAVWDGLPVKLAVAG